VDSTARANQRVWDEASRKHVREHDDLREQAASGSSLTSTERDLLRAILRSGPEVLHLQSGHGIDDVALVLAGAKSVVGIDYSKVAVRAAQRRADELGAACRYAVGWMPELPVASQSADLVYTGKGALIWLSDLTEWAAEVARVLRPEGHLFVYEAHPSVPLWTWDEDRPRIREDRSYFGRTHVNDTFPARGAVEWQWTLGDVVTSVATAGMDIVHLGEYPDPFWRPHGVFAAAWSGRLPNTFSLLARRSP
jgi:ubiquinone/menaquinone biosynthesis C-methylase UbiE